MFESTLPDLMSLFSEPTPMTGTQLSGPAGSFGVPGLGSQAARTSPDANARAAQVMSHFADSILPVNAGAQPDPGATTAPMVGSPTSTAPAPTAGPAAPPLASIRPPLTMGAGQLPDDAIVTHVDTRCLADLIEHLPWPAQMRQDRGWGLHARARQVASRFDGQAIIGALNMGDIDIDWPTWQGGIFPKIFTVTPHIRLAPRVVHLQCTSTAAASLSRDVARDNRDTNKDERTADAGIEVTLPGGKINGSLSATSSNERANGTTTTDHLAATPAYAFSGLVLWTVTLDMDYEDRCPALMSPGLFRSDPVELPPATTVTQVTSMLTVNIPSYECVG